MVAKVGDRESRRDSWFENRLVLFVVFCFCLFVCLLVCLGFFFFLFCFVLFFFDAINHITIDYFRFQSVSQAIDYYNKALGKIEQRRRNKPVWDSISWELSTTHFTMATLLQDHPPLSRMAQEQVCMLSNYSLFFLYI